jgi:hypothetical protein
MKPAAPLMLLLAVTAAGAEPLPYGDPTEPPPGFAAAAEASSGSAAIAPATTAPPEPWRLTATLVDAQRRVAIINGRSVAVGARIDGARLLAVEMGSAQIEHQGRRIRLQLPVPEGRSMNVKQAPGK